MGGFCKLNIGPPYTVLCGVQDDKELMKTGRMTFQGHDAAKMASLKCLDPDL